MKKHVYIVALIVSIYAQYVQAEETPKDTLKNPATVLLNPEDVPFIELKGHKDGVISLIFSSDRKKIVTVGNDRTARIWDANTGTLLQTLEHANRVSSAIPSPDGKKVVTVSDDFSNNHTVRIWNADSGETLQIMEGYANRVPKAAFSPDGKKIASVNNDRTVRIWDTNSGKILRTLELGFSIYTVAFSPDGTKIVAGGDSHRAYVWEVDSGRLLGTLDGPKYSEEYDDDGGTVWSAIFSPDGSKIVTTGYDHITRIWDAESGKVLRTLKHTRAVEPMPFSPDGRKIITQDAERIGMWDVESEIELRQIKTPSWKTRFLNAAFSPDGKRIMAATNIVLVDISYTTTVRIWTLESTP